MNDILRYILCSFGAAYFLYRLIANLSYSIKIVMQKIKGTKTEKY